MAHILGLEGPEHLHALVHVRHLLGRVEGKHTRTLTAPDVQQQHDARGEQRHLHERATSPLRSHCDQSRTHLVEVGRLTEPFALDVEYVDARPRCVSTDSERWEAQRRRLARGRDKWPMHRDLQLVVVRVQVRRLVQEQQVLPRRVPPHCDGRTDGR